MRRKKTVIAALGILASIFIVAAISGGIDSLRFPAGRPLTPPERTESGRITRPPSLPEPPFRAATLEGELAAYLGLEPLLTLLRADVTAEHTGEFRPAHTG